MTSFTAADRPRAPSLRGRPATGLEGERLRQCALPAMVIDRVVDRIRRTVNFTIGDGATEIYCCITFEALQRLARVSGNVAEIAERLFDRHRHEIEPIVLARYAAGDFDEGVIRLDVSDFHPPPRAR